MSNPLRQPLSPVRLPWLTYLLCTLSVGLSAGFWLTGAHTSTWGHFRADEIWSGQWGGLITAVFLHAPLTENPFHLLFNMVWLVRLGEVIERALGHLEFGVLVLTAACVASAAELAFANSTGIGMSGVVYALFGLAWGARGRFPAFRALASPDNVRFFLGWMALCFLLTELGYWRIANYAHAGGLLLGGAVAWAFVQTPLPSNKRAAAGATLALLAALTILSLTYMPWSRYWRVWRANPQAFTRALTSVEP